MPYNMYQVYIVAVPSGNKLFLDGTEAEPVTLTQAILYALENASAYPTDSWLTAKIIHVKHKDSDEPCYSVYNLDGKFIESAP